MADPKAGAALTCRLLRNLVRSSSRSGTARCIEHGSEADIRGVPALDLQDRAASRPPRAPSGSLYASGSAPRTYSGMTFSNPLAC